jgi:diguanylate cyclase (GGDEF)-like protein
MVSNRVSNSLDRKPMPTVRARLALVVLLALLPALGVMLHAASDNRRDHLAAGQAQLLQAARLIAEEHEQLVEGARQLLLALRSSAALDGGELGRCRTRLGEVLADAAGRYANLLLFGRDGRLLCDGLGQTDVPRIDGEPYFRRALAGGLGIGPHVAARDGTGRPVLPIALPLVAEYGPPERVLVADLSLDWLHRYEACVDLPAGAALAIADAAGRLLTSSRGEQDSGGPVPWAAARDGPRVVAVAGRLIGLSPAAGGSLLVAVSAPEAKITADADHLLWLELASVALALLLGFGLAALVGERTVAHRLRMLTRFAQRLRDGDLAARPPAPEGKDELAELARVLDHMAGGLETRVSALTASEARQRHRARHDELTGLPNRRGFLERLATELAAARRHQDQLALLLLDLDRFKQVNDTLGHPAGDALLAATAARMRMVVREEDVVARLGGDEFTVLLVGRGQDLAPHEVARRLVEALAEPFDLDGHTIRTSASVGVALFPQHGAGPAELLQAADDALYAAKRSGRGQWQPASRAVG